jgi:hypothetical protein
VRRFTIEGRIVTMKAVNYVGKSSRNTRYRKYTKWCGSIAILLILTWLPNVKMGQRPKYQDWLSNLDKYVGLQLFKANFAEERAKSLHEEDFDYRSIKHWLAWRNNK